MANKLRWLTGVAALALVFARLTRLLQPTIDGPPWILVLSAMAALGGVVTWITRSYRVSWASIASIGLVAATLAAFRIIGPSTLVWGILPTGETFTALNSELDFAIEVFRFGSAPVIAIPGLVAVLGLLAWLFGSLIAVAVVTNRPWVGSVGPLVFYLQLATLDRRSSTVAWISAFAVVAATAVIASGPGPDGRTGRLRDRGGVMIPRRTATMPVVLAGVMVLGAVLATDRLASAVPEAGAVDWRTQNGVGAGLYGQGSSFNLFAGLQQSLLSLGDQPMFFARMNDAAPPNEELYWRLITLDVFDGTNWIPGSQPYAKQGEGRYELEDWMFQGPTTTVSARVRIADLAQQLLPVLYSTTDLQSTNPLITESFRVRTDGSIGIDLRTREGWEYELRADVPDPDIAQLASLGGELSPIFQEAADAGRFDLAPKATRFVDRPEVVDEYLELPDDVSLAVRQAAREITDPGVTRFEKALILEAWFRDSDNFIYSTDVSTGHSSLDLETWLLNPEVSGFRTGYCEQFATAMAVMARSLGLPSRVVLGFTPGDIQIQEDGSEVVVVRENNAHAWVELWMDGQGWIRFDPTPRGDGVNPSLADTEIGFDARAFVPAPDEVDEGGSTSGRLPGERDPALPDFDEGTGDATPDLRGQFSPSSIPIWVRWLALAVVIGSSLPLYKIMRRRRRLKAIATGNIEMAWVEITDRLKDLGNEIGHDLTPIEIAQQHNHAIVPLARMYSAQAYGGEPIGDSRHAFKVADDQVTVSLSRSDRIREHLSIASLR